MQTFFGVVSDDQLETSGTDGLFYYNGNYYFYCLTLGDEGVIVEDTIGRYLPIDLEDILPAAMAMVMAARKARDVQTAEEQYEAAIEQSDNTLAQMAAQWNGSAR